MLLKILILPKKSCERKFDMESRDVEKIERIIKERKYSHSYFQKTSKAYNSFMELAQAAFADGEIDRRHKELIALGISVAINCEACMEHHIGEALRAGASEKQVIECIDVAIEMGGGPATVSARFALKALEYYLQKNRG